MTPNYVTIVTPLESDSVESCRQYLRDNADPQLGQVDAFLECRPLFRFDEIASMHFCSFVILGAADGIPPSLVFEATFDGSRDDFLNDLLRIAPEGLDTIYRRCAGYPISGIATPELVKEYFVRHDVGANTFFSGSPGRTVSQIRGEGRIRDNLAAFLSERCQAGEKIPGRAVAILDIVRDVVRGAGAANWAEQPVRLPWEMTFRNGIALAAVIAVVVLASLLGALVCWAAGHGPESLHRIVNAWLQTADQIGGRIDNQVTTVFPWVGELVPMIQTSTLRLLSGLTLAWVVVRVCELLLKSVSRDVRDQFLIWRFPLQLLVVTRFALVAYIVGTVLLAAVSGADALAPEGTNSFWGMFKELAAVGVQLVLIGLLLLIGWHFTTSLNLAIELQPLDETWENLRRMALDLLWFAMLVLGGIGVLLIASVLPAGFIGSMARIIEPIVNFLFLFVFFAVVGIFAAYAVGLLAMLTIGAMEHQDKSKFDSAAGLLSRARENAKKYAREEGGINRFQNHLASVTTVKPGVLRRWLLRLVLFAINLLSRFWFNRGELGGIPTILSARWVLIDGGRRLLFLDNYGGAWESYLNEFIDLAAVKGLNAIWTNTFVSAAGKTYSFPPTRFLFWRGAQDARPFKAYVRQSQVETIVWYGAYPTLSVVGINANTDVRQALFQQLQPAGVDRLLQGF